MFLALQRSGLMGDSCGTIKFRPILPARVEKARNNVIYMHPFYDSSGGSSSASSAGTGSSTGGGPGNPAGGGRMAVIGVTRHVRLRRRGNAGFGFSLRGGREYAAGFYVSDVQPGGEAHRNGLRVRFL